MQMRIQAQLDYWQMQAGELRTAYGPTNSSASLLRVKRRSRINNAPAL